MDSQGIDHVALHVESLTQAETLYGRLFGMEVVQHGECESADGSGESLDGSAAGEFRRPEYIVLEGAGFRLALRREIADFAPHGRLSHISLRLSMEYVPDLLDRAASLGCLVHITADGRHRIEDPYEVSWEIICPTHHPDG